MVHQQWSIYFWVGLGSAIGGIGRLWVSSWMSHRFGPAFPWGTLTVNFAGSLLLGFLATLALPDGRWEISPRMSQFLMVGFCGGFTTFSTFSWQTLDLVLKGQLGYACWNVAASVALCMAGVSAGYGLGHAWQQN